jgi:iron complex transport system ATP-binding protein
MTAMVAKGVEVRAGGRTILDGATIAAGAGRVLALLGPNGAGKSTLMRVMAGLQQPERGAVTLDGQPLSAIRPQDRARRIAWLAQDRTVHWPMPVRAIVALGRLPHIPPGGRFSSADATAVDATAVDGALAAMDVTALADRPVLEISGGERARVLMARALAQHPAILLADEPVAGLDPAHQIALMHHLRRCASAGMCVVAALHDLSLAARFADDAVLLAGGRTVASGPVREVLTPARLLDVYGVQASITDVDGVPVVVTRDIAAQHPP